MKIEIEGTKDHIESVRKAMHDLTCELPFIGKMREYGTNGAGETLYRHMFRCGDIISAPPVKREFRKLDHIDRAYNNAIRRCQVWLEEGGVVYDCETSDWPPPKGHGEIIQLTIADLNTAEILFSSYFNPNGTITSGSQSAHGITLEMVASAPKFAERATQIHDILSQAPNCIAYNTPFDGNMINIEFERSEYPKIPGLNFTRYCAMHRAAEVYGEWNPQYSSFKWQKLATMGEYLGLDWKGVAHDASADVLMTIDVIKTIARLDLRG